MTKFSFKGKSIVFVMFLLSLFVFSTFAVFKSYNLEYTSPPDIESVGTEIFFNESSKPFSYGEFYNFLQGVEFDDFTVVHSYNYGNFEIYEAANSLNFLGDYEDSFKEFTFGEFDKGIVCYEGYENLIENSSYNYKNHTYDVVGSTTLEFSNMYIPLAEVSRNSPDELFKGKVYFLGPHSAEIYERFVNVLREGSVGYDYSSTFDTSLISKNMFNPIFKYVIIIVALLFFCVDTRFLLRYWIGYSMDEIFKSEFSSVKEKEVTRYFTKRFFSLASVGVLLAVIVFITSQLLFGQSFIFSFKILASSSLIVLGAFAFCYWTVQVLISNFYEEGIF